MVVLEVALLWRAAELVLAVETLLLEVAVPLQGNAAILQLAMELALSVAEVARRLARGGGLLRLRQVKYGRRDLMATGKCMLEAGSNDDREHQRNVDCSKGQQRARR